MGPSCLQVARMVGVDIHRQPHRVAQRFWSSYWEFFLSIFLEILPLFSIDIIKHDIINKFKLTIENNSAFVFL